MQNKKCLERCLELIRDKRYRELSAILAEQNPVDLADLLEGLPQEQGALAFRTLPKEQAAEVFSNLPPDTQQMIVVSLPDRELAGILEELAMSVEDLEENALNLGEEIDVLSDDLADVESIVYDEDDDDEDDEDYDDDWFEVECPTCEEPLVIDDKALADGMIQCPNCHDKFALDLSDDTVEADDEE